MGRTTVSYRVAVLRELERIRRIVYKMPPDERTRWERILEDFEDTIILYSDVPVLDPLEVVILHVLRKTVKGLKD